MVMKTEAVTMIMNKMRKAVRKWTKRMTKPAEELKMPSQRTTASPVALMLPTGKLLAVLM